MCISRHIKKIYSNKNVVGPQLVNCAKPERENSGVRSALELEMCTNSVILKALKELSHNINKINRRVDLIESMFDK